jgi:adenylate cyclase
MRAHWHIRRFRREDMAEARRLLGEAIDLDPANAIALGDLSFANHFEACFAWCEDVTQSYARAGEMARRALAIDDSDAHAHSALAIYDLFQDRHEEARRRLRRAIDLDPNSPFARGYLGCSYGFAGDYETALPLLEEAIRLSPRDPLLVIWHFIAADGEVSTRPADDPRECRRCPCSPDPVVPGLPPSG